MKCIPKVFCLTFGMHFNFDSLLVVIKRFQMLLTPCV